MPRISIEQSVEKVEVDLYGRIFVTVPVTRSVQQHATALDKESQAALADDDPDSVVEFMGKMLDLRLKPSDGGRKPASAVIKEAWEADKLSVGQLLALVEQMANPS